MNLHIVTAMGELIRCIHGFLHFRPSFGNHIHLIDAKGRLSTMTDVFYETRYEYNDGDNVRENILYTHLLW